MLSRFLVPLRCQTGIISCHQTPKNITICPHGHLLSTLDLFRSFSRDLSVNEPFFEE